MKESLKTGFSFGITSGVITTLGLMVGLAFGTGSKIAVIGGVLTIAIADSMSDALGIHISEEAGGKHTQKEIWTSTIATFVTKLVFASSFIIPVLLFELDLALLISVLWGMSLLSVFSYRLAKENNNNAIYVILEHLLVATVVIVATYFIGKYINSNFS